MPALPARHVLGEIVAHYVQPANSTRCELHLVPLSREFLVAEPREFLDSRRPEVSGLPAKFQPLLADNPHSLVQIKLAEDPSGGGFASGITLLESSTMETLDFDGQEVATNDDSITISTTLRDRNGRFRCVHHLSYSHGEAGLRCWTEFFNDCDTPLTLELLTSFALNGLTPFSAGNSTPHQHLHRFRSWWSLEGRVESMSLEALHLERSWGGFGTFSERFGQVGSLPVRHWFPTTAIEDSSVGVVWAAQLGWAGSWQMEVMRRGDRATLAGGLADREFGHWMKSVQPGETFVTPTAYLTTVAGDLDVACNALLDGQRSSLGEPPKAERDLPICFNEWCTSWGNPTHDSILAIAHRLEGTGVRYIVIDDGWSIRPPEAIMQSNGDWLVDETKFPGGLKPTCDALRDLGFIPGIWFEFEVVNPGSRAWEEEGHLIQRDGRTLQVGQRRFWNFNDPWVEEHLARRVIELLRDNGFGYLKVDYNDSIGLGVDHPDSLGEGLRLHLEGVQRFFRRLTDELPDLVIENCSSGGHRLEPSMQALASMGSFSDAHEAVIIPIIARNLHRLILPRQSLIWAVLHRADDSARLHYSLSATFLGRVCLSGDIHELADWQMEIVRRAIEFYGNVTDVIDHGRSHFHGPEALSYVDPRGWQAVVRIHEDRALIVAHGFDLAEPLDVTLPIPGEGWTIADQFGDTPATLGSDAGQTFRMTLSAGFTGGAWSLTR